MTAIEKQDLDEADRQIAAEDKAARDRRVKERAIRIMGERRRVGAGASAPSLAEMKAELAALNARPDWALAAAEDERKTFLEREIYAITRNPADVGLRPRDAA